MSHWLYAGLYHSFSQTISRQITTWIVTRLRHTCITLHCALQQFSLQYQNVIGFSLLSYPIGLKNSRFFSSNQNKPKTNRESPPLVFPRFASATSNFLKFWLVHWFVYALRDWLEWWLVLVCDTPLKTALTRNLNCTSCRTSAITMTAS